MRIQDLDGKTVCVLGYGKEGQATVRALERYAPACEITIADQREDIERRGNHWIQSGTGWLKNLEKFNVIIKSPGIPPLPAFKPVQDRITNASQIFLDTVSQAGSTVIGVTGSKGKSTTASLIAAVLKTAGKDTFLVGNIGNPALDVLEQATKDTFFVLEMSSYQLLDMTGSPHIAVVTSFFPEHLDYHASTALSTGSTPLEAYRDAKMNITRYQTQKDIVFYNALFPTAIEIAERSPGKKVPFSPSDAPVRIEETQLLGRHNLGNMAAAFLVASELRIDRETCVRAFRAFSGLPHRLQLLGTVHGIEWIDDSISTTPESAIAALDALGERVETIILGGQDRGYDFLQLAKRLARSAVRQIILFPGSGPRIREALLAAGATATVVDANSMEEAVDYAKARTETSQLVLLSPASPSYGMFKNFEERGAAFASAIGITPR